jgi:hypothetical protein
MQDEDMRTRASSTTEQTGKKRMRTKELISDLQDFYLLSSRGLLGLIRKPFYF